MMLRFTELSETHVDPIELRSERAKFYREWGERSGRSAVEHAMVQDRTLVCHAFEGWLQVDPDAPKAWVLSQSASDTRRSVLATSLLHALPATDHRARAEWVGKFVNQASVVAFVSEVAIAWGKDRPSEALGWLSGLPDSGARASGIEAVTQRWAKLEPEEASAHLTKMPEGKAKDVAIRSLSKAIYGNDPEVALLWAETVAGEGLHEGRSEGTSELAASNAAVLPEL
jgi:hypothetical protein